MKNTLKIYFIAAMLCLIFNQSVAKELLTSVQLTWTPTTEINEVSRLVPEEVLAVKIKIPKFEDARTIDPKNRVGMNKEDGKSLPVDTVSDIADFVTQNIHLVLQKSNLQIDDKADYSLSGKIIEYFVNETNTYEAVLSIQYTLKKDAKTLWQGTVTAQNSRFGRSYKLDNYQESLSDVIIENLKALMTSQNFKNAFPQAKPAAIATGPMPQVQDGKDLYWKPTTKMSSFTKISFQEVAAAQIKIINFSDARKTNDRNLVAEYVKENKKLRTNTDISKFISDNFSQTLSKAGLKIEDNGSYILGAQIRDFFIKEEGSYNGLLTLNMTLKKADKVLWNGIIVGKASRWGRSNNMDNYMEVFSDSIVDAAYELLKNEDFKKSFQTKTQKN